MCSGVSRRVLRYLIVYLVEGAWSKKESYGSRACIEFEFESESVGLRDRTCTGAWEIHSTSYSTVIIGGC